MLYLKIETEKETKSEILDFLGDVQIAIKEGNTIGVNWQLRGEEHKEPDE